MTSTEILTREDMLSVLPDCVLYEIFLQLVEDGLGEHRPWRPVSMKDAKNFVIASKRLHNCLKSALLWAGGRYLAWLPLFYGAQNGIIELIEACLDVGAPVDFQNPDGMGQVADGEICNPELGRTPLVQAVGANQVEAVGFPLERGANPYDPRAARSGRSSLHCSLELQIAGGLPETQRALEFHLQLHSVDETNERLASERKKALLINQALVKAGAPDDEQVLWRDDPNMRQTVREWYERLWSYKGLVANIERRQLESQGETEESPETQSTGLLIWHPYIYA